MTRPVGEQPFHGNALRTRTDLQEAVRSLFAPLQSHFSPGGARVGLGHTGVTYADRCVELEGFARPLWGLVPLAAGGGAFAGWDLYRRGLSHGTDPEHPEYWGDPGANQQMLVEMAPIGLSLALVSHEVWAPLGADVQQRLALWLQRINAVSIWDNNWLFFRVIVNLGLARVGAKYDATMMAATLDRLESFYLGDGWYSDGPSARRDYYIPFAMHFYGLITAALVESTDPARARRFRERAGRFAHEFIYWFAADGAAVPYGRSLTYRFAQGAFWGALAFAGVEALPWPVIKGVAMRHLRWWASQPIFDAEGVLSIGYTYPNLNMAESYNSAASPYWALEFFLPLALPDSHPFWLAEEAPLPSLQPARRQPQPGMIVCADQHRRHVFALANGQEALWVRHGAEKYGKFAYSSAFGFSVPGSTRGIENLAPDSTLLVSDDGEHFRGRAEILESNLQDGMLHSAWRPWPDVAIETWLIPALPWHIRVHRIRSKRSFVTVEGGFATGHPGDHVSETGSIRTGPAFALAINHVGWSGMRDLSGSRTGCVIYALPNTNLMHPRSAIPILRGTHGAGEHWLTCAVLGAAGSGSYEDVWCLPPALPSLEGLPEIGSLLRARELVWRIRRSAQAAAWRARAGLSLQWRR